MSKERKMTKEMKAEWLKRLRGNRYKQCTASLVKKDTPDGPLGYCCIGVLCSIAKKISNRKNEAKIMLNDINLVEYHDECLSTAGLEYFGLNNTLQSTLITMNDNKLSTFSEIADFIDKAVKVK